MLWPSVKKANSLPNQNTEFDKRSISKQKHKATRYRVNIVLLFFEPFLAVYVVVATDDDGVNTVSRLIKTLWNYDGNGNIKKAIKPLI